LEINGERVRGEEEIIKPERGEQTRTYYYTPRWAGQHTITTCHNADELRHSRNENGEAYRGDDDEYQSQQITVYRYLCYQGFCYECEKEPQRNGILRVSGKCTVVEPEKCKAYIGSDCKAKGRE